MSVSSISFKPTFLLGKINDFWVNNIKGRLTETDPNRLKERNLLLRIEAAKSHGRLSEGVTEAWISASNRKGKLFIAEKSVLFPDKHQKKQHDLRRMGLFNNSPVTLETLVDETITKVLEDGGSIEFVENGFLEDYKHMVMIQRD